MCSRVFDLACKVSSHWSINCSSYRIKLVAIGLFNIVVIIKYVLLFSIFWCNCGLSYLCKKSGWGQGSFGQSVVC